MKQIINLGFLFVMITPVTSYSQESIEERVERLEKALISIEKKIDKILPPIASSSNKNSIKKKQSDKINKLSSVLYDPGLWMEFYKIDSENKSIPTIVSGLSLGVMLDKDVSSLKYSSFRSDSNLNRYYRDYFGLLWSGALEIRNTGKHIIGVDLVVDSKVAIRTKCATSMTLSGKPVAKISASISEKKQIFSDLKNLDLKEGLYPISVWLSCKKFTDLRYIDIMLDGVSTVIKHRGPYEKTIGAINTSWLVHRTD